MAANRWPQFPRVTERRRRPSPNSPGSAAPARRRETRTRWAGPRQARSPPMTARGPARSVESPGRSSTLGWRPRSPRVPPSGLPRPAPIGSAPLLRSRWTLQPSRELNATSRHPPPRGALRGGGTRSRSPHAESEEPSALTWTPAEGSRVGRIAQLVRTDHREVSGRKAEQDFTSSKHSRPHLGGWGRAPVRRGLPSRGFRPSTPSSRGHAGPWPPLSSRRYPLPRRF